MSEAPKYLNLGCGSRHHPDWINIDIIARGPEVLQADLSRGIPFPDASCDVVYNTAVLEHLRIPDAATFLRECYRVLKPSGIVRIGVPDLEKLCRLYIDKLTDALKGDHGASDDYDWVLLELFDQTVRECSGGGMVEFLRKNPLPSELFVYERIGEEGRQLVQALRQKGIESRRPGPNILRRQLKRLRSLPGLTKHTLLQWLLGADGMRALNIGRFRLAGEVHQWMYDRYSLARLLEQTGFRSPQLQNASASLIPNWTNYHLDMLPNGQVIKPDLFFMEAIK